MNLLEVMRGYDEAAKMIEIARRECAGTGAWAKVDRIHVYVVKESRNALALWEGLWVDESYRFEVTA